MTWPIPDWEVAADPEDTEVSVAGRDALVDWLEEEAGGRPYGTVVVHHGTIACEHYGGGATAESCWEIGSIRKSVMSALLGMAIAEGRLSLETRIHDIWPDIASLTGQEKDKHIQMRHLATMTSGWMTGSAPGEEFLYNNAACTAAGAALGRVHGLAGDRIAPLVAERIAAPIGAATWRVYHYEEEFDNGNPGQPGPKLAIDSDLRDLARYGCLWLRGGRWAGSPLVPEAHIREAQRNHVASFGHHYGYWWFTNDDCSVLPSAPADAFFHGGNGRHHRCSLCLICPSLDLVAVLGTDARAFDTAVHVAGRSAENADVWIAKTLSAFEGP